MAKEGASKAFWGCWPGAIAWRGSNGSLLHDSLLSWTLRLYALSQRCVIFTMKGFYQKATGGLIRPHTILNSFFLEIEYLSLIHFPESPGVS